MAYFRGLLNFQGEKTKMMKCVHHHGLCCDALRQVKAAGESCVLPRWLCHESCWRIIPGLAINNHGSEGEICESSPECLSKEILHSNRILDFETTNFNYIACILKTKIGIIGIIPKTNSMFACENRGF